jgi:hypothetical protein
MTAGAFAKWLLEQEARALLTRLDRMKPFALNETMVPAAGLSFPAQVSIERYLAEGRKRLRHMIHAFRVWLDGLGSNADPAMVQRRFTFLRLRFNAVLTQFDLFSDLITQRSEHETGIWLAGLDALASGALALPGRYFQAPAVVCYLDRGVGAAIRRARTRLPGGGKNPVAIIRVPRERMVGSGVASSLVHETGHQGAALLGLLPTLHEEIALRKGWLWRYWSRWISEIVADLWSVARVGVTATLGLLGVVSLPRAFVFRMQLDDPHPFPWIRVKLSCAMGQALYPHPQWARLSRLWESFYPKDGLPAEAIDLLAALEEGVPDLIDLLMNHRPPILRGDTLAEALQGEELRPARLMEQFETCLTSPRSLKRAPPCLVFATLGQARMEGKLSPEREGQMLSELLTHWALDRALNPSAACRALGAMRLTAPVH